SRAPVPGPAGTSASSDSHRPSPRDAPLRPRRGASCVRERSGPRAGSCRETLHGNISSSNRVLWRECRRLRRTRETGGRMELRLLETKRKAQKKTLFRVGATSLALHAAVIGGAVYVTLSARPADTAVRMDPSGVLLAPAHRQPALPPTAQLAEPLRGFQTVSVPMVLPSSMPKIDLQERFDPKDYSGIGVEGGRAKGAVPSGNEGYSEALVEERPALLSAPP